VNPRPGVRWQPKGDTALAGIVEGKSAMQWGTEGSESAVAAGALPAHSKGLRSFASLGEVWSAVANPPLYTEFFTLNRPAEWTRRRRKSPERMTLVYWPGLWLREWSSSTTHL
jgi:hypothetical protein